MIITCIEVRLFPFPLLLPHSFPKYYPGSEPTCMKAIQCCESTVLILLESLLCFPEIMPLQSLWFCFWFAKKLLRTCCFLTLNLSLVFWGIAQLICIFFILLPLHCFEREAGEEGSALTDMITDIIPALSYPRP